MQSQQWLSARRWRAVINMVIPPLFTALALALLLYSWVISYYWLMALTEGWGAPWDTTNIRPPVGQWQRTINDFFESGIGSYLPAFAFLTSNVILFLGTLRHTRNALLTSLLYGLTNVVGIVVVTLVLMPFQPFLDRPPAHLTPADWSYWGDFRREWPLAASAIAMIVVCLTLQAKLLRHYVIGMTRS